LASCGHYLKGRVIMPSRFDRSFKIAHRAASDGVVEMAISSEAPYERWYGVEILSHDASAVDLSRLADNCHPLLLNHCTEDQIGVLSDPQIGADRMLRCAARFSRSAMAQEILQDVQDGIRQLVSVGYFVDEIVELEPQPDPDLADWIGSGERGYKFKRTLSGEAFEAEMRSKYGESFQRSGPAAVRDGMDAPDIYLVTRWTPFEASIVPIPADVTVGIGRSAGADPKPAQEVKPTVKPTPQEIRIMTETVTKSAAETELERRDAIATLGENPSYAKYLKAGDVATAIREGWSRDKFVEFLMSRMASAHTDQTQVQIGLSQREIQRYSLSRAIVASATRDWQKAGFELECSRAVEKLTGQQAAGFLVPPDVFAQRDLVVGTATSAGNLVPTEFRGDLFVDVLRNNLVATQLGVRMLTGLTGNVDIPRKATSATIGTTTEIGSASQSDITTAKLTLSPKRMTAYTVASLRALQQSGIPLDPILRDDLLQGVAVQIENGYINGTGTDPQMQGLRYASGIGTVAAGSNGGTVTWGNIVGLESACANANAEPDSRAGYLTNTKQRGNLKQIQKGTNLPFIWDGGDMPVNGYRCAITNNVPSNLTKGTSTTVCSAALFSSDWSMSVIGIFGAPDITVDPYTKADTGEVKITINAFADSGVRQPGAFAKCEDLL
jgi:HK97 family phage major capsid protein